MVLSFGLFAQTDTSYWKKGAAATFTLNQVSLTNWQAGGESSLSLNMFIILRANYEKELWKWD